MSNIYSKLINKLTKRPLSINELEVLLSDLDNYCDASLELELLQSSGLPLVFIKDQVFLKTTLTQATLDSYCIVDIETNGHNPQLHQPIEIGAILYKEGRVERTFSSLIFCKEIPQAVTKLTGITPDMLVNAPHLKSVLETFRVFLGDSILVAHNADFDFNFLSQCLDYYDFGALYNFRICTIKLARKLIKSERYSLGYLNEFLEINHFPLHRAYDDSVIAFEIFKKCLKLLPKSIYTSQDLIQFATQ
ncbi:MULTISPECIES: 3'-5' exonuclease [Helicobacter]|uniref:3'-5' exonuclease n=1 Tax=Helicobacter ibis TaxID=2962633 RepID=A0ABT4VCF8_9HELI|nr:MULTISPECIES: 3'-5' exonuclease [Helicobacter]MDA3967625.1 3'-5' exonuclease [Helicobacter sp. WB40]MDA3968379.1 3'-5' exonuclease [Helicobacter ibis]